MEAQAIIPVVADARTHQMVKAHSFILHISSSRESIDVAGICGRCVLGLLLGGNTAVALDYWEAVRILLLVLPLICLLLFFGFEFSKDRDSYIHWLITAASWGWVRFWSWLKELTLRERLSYSTLVVSFL
jgi:hypothetical protein